MKNLAELFEAWKHDLTDDRPPHEVLGLTWCEFEAWKAKHYEDHSAGTH